MSKRDLVLLLEDILVASYLSFLNLRNRGKAKLLRSMFPVSIYTKLFNSFHGSVLLRTFY